MKTILRITCYSIIPQVMALVAANGWGMVRKALIAWGHVPADAQGAAWGLIGISSIGIALVTGVYHAVLDAQKESKGKPGSSNYAD